MIWAAAGAADMDRTVSTVVVVFVLLAGCAGFGPGGSDTSTETPAPTGASTPTPAPTTTPTATPTEAPETGVPSYPNGWSATGVDDPNAALTAHYRAMLAGPSVTVTYRSRIREATNERAANTTLSMAVGTDTRRLYADIEGSQSSSESFFADGTLTQWNVENETVTDRSSARFIRVAQSIDQGVLTSHLILYTLRRNGTVERAGTTAFVYDVSGVQDNAMSQTYGTATDASGRIIVGESGRVFEVATTVTYTNGTVTYRYEHVGIGETTVETPTWADGS